MSRAKATDVSSPISLFPFIGILLCTMGALLVVLIAVSPSAREVVSRQAASRRPPRNAEADRDTRAKLQEVHEFVSELDRVRSEAEHKLREDQMRLSHLEGHMRRLQEKLQSLQLAASELTALEEEHYDDRDQAEREVGRLHQLIASTREAIDSLKQEQQTKKRSYALVTYEGANGTTRRPIYVECVNGEILLQPEGVHITEDDLQPPFGPGNVLASALRAARDHLVSLHPEEGRNRDTEPYPLVIVRPSGTAMYSRAQKAIQTGDFDFGYELVEEDWELKYPAADPQLAHVEQQAIEQARIRLMALAAAAPRAYRHPGLAAAGRFDDEPGYGPAGYGSGSSSAGGGGGGGEGPFTGEGGGGFGGPGHAGPPGEFGGQAGGGSTAAGGAPGPNRQSGGSGGADSRRSGQGNDSGGQQVADASASHSDHQSATTDDPNGVPGGPFKSGGTSPTPANGVAASGASGSGQPQASVAASNGASFGSSAGSGMDAGPGQMNGSVDYSQVQTELAKSRGNDWALRRKGARAVPVRRSIQIYVGKDHLSIASDEWQRHGRSAGKTISLKRDTVASIDELVDAVHDQIESWGMAGDGLYWRPVLSLHVSPDGSRRADDLRRLLKNSGLELQYPVTATQPPRGNRNATSR
jgi:hypothetical protein